MIVKRDDGRGTSTNPDLRGNIILMHDSGGDRSQDRCCCCRS